MTGLQTIPILEGMTMDCETASVIKYVAGLGGIVALGVAGLVVDGDAGTAMAIACAGAVGLFLPSPIIKTGGGETNAEKVPK